MIKGKINISLLSLSIQVMVIATLAFRNYTAFVLTTQVFSLLITLLNGRLCFTKELRDYMTWWGLFISFCVLSFFWTVNTDTRLAMLISLLQVAAIGFVIVNFCADNKDNFIRIMKTACFSCFVLCIRFLIQVPFSLWRTERIGNYIGYGNDGAAFVLAFGAVFAFALSTLLDNKKYFLLTLVFCGVSLFTGSKIGVLVVAVGVAAVSFFRRDKLSKKVMFAIFAVVLVVVFSYMIMNVPLLYQIIGYRFDSLLYVLKNGVAEGQTYYNSSEARYLLIKYGWDLFSNNPIIGVGLDGFRKVVPMGGKTYYAHNNYIELLVDVGIIGTYLYYFLPIKTLIRGIKSIKYNKKMSIIVALFIAFAVFDIGMVTFNDETVHVFFALLYSLYVLVKKERYSEQHEEKIYI